MPTTKREDAMRLPTKREVSHPRTRPGAIHALPAGIITGRAALVEGGREGSALGARSAALQSGARLKTAEVTHAAGTGLWTRFERRCWCVGMHKPNQPEAQARDR